MVWIDSVGYRSGRFVLNTLTATGESEALGLEALAKPWHPGHGRRQRITTDCSTWHRETGAPFRQLLGIDVGHAQDMHGVFSFEAGGKHYLIPASVLIAAMVQPIQHLHRYLFKPQGLGSFCIPLMTDQGPTVGLWHPERTLFGYYLRKEHGRLARLSWMHSFPSANAMWSSAYRIACDGRLDMSLPKAMLTANVRTVAANDALLITEMTLAAIEALETPYPFAADHPKDIVLHASARLDWSRLHHPEGRIVPRNDGTWHLSDSEWLAIEARLPERRKGKFEFRAILDCIITKFGLGTPWRKQDFGDLNLSIVQVTYQRMTNNGDWARIVKLLGEMRADASG